jgi:hypothetical protein
MAGAQAGNLGPAVMKELKKWRLDCPKHDLDLVFPNNMVSNF